MSPRPTERPEKPRQVKGYGAAPSRSPRSPLPTPRLDRDAKEGLERVGMRLLGLRLQVPSPDGKPGEAAAGRLLGKAVLLEQTPGWRLRSSSKQGWGVPGILLPAQGRTGRGAEEFRSTLISRFPAGKLTVTSRSGERLFRARGATPPDAPGGNEPATKGT